MGRTGGGLRPAVPGELVPAPGAGEGQGRGGVAAAGVAVGVLCLWTPFTLVVAWVLERVPGCQGSGAAICGPGGHLVGMWAATVGSGVGLAVVGVGCWVWPRRGHGLFALAGLAAAVAGVLITFGLASGAPVA